MITKPKEPPPEVDLEELEEPPPQRPRKRADCEGGPRPCPWVSCQFHLYLQVNRRTGEIFLNVPDKEPWEMAETCALDVADRGGASTEEVGEILGLCRERIRQLEATARLDAERRARKAGIEIRVFLRAEEPVVVRHEGLVSRPLAELATTRLDERHAREAREEEETLEEIAERRRRGSQEEEDQEGAYPRGGDDE